MKAIKLALLLLAPCSQAVATTPADQLRPEALMSMIEPAGSKGEIGSSFGVSVTRIPSRQESTASQNEVDSRASQPESFQLGHYVRGTPWPLDLFVTFGHDQATAGTVLGGGGQYTAFQIPAGPALSAWASFAQINRPHSSSDNFGTQVVISQGLGSRVVLSLGVSGARSQITRGDQGDPSTQLSSSGFAGLQLRLFPEFVFITGEVSQTAGGLRTVAGKLSVAI